MTTKWAVLTQIIQFVNKSPKSSLIHCTIQCNYIHVLNVVFSCSVVPESPRWLCSVGRYDEAKIILEKCARMNKKSLPENFNIFFTEKVHLAN